MYIWEFLFLILQHILNKNTLKYKLSRSTNLNLFIKFYLLNTLQFDIFNYHADLETANSKQCQSQIRCAG